MCIRALSAIKHVHLLAEHYSVAVVLHTDHAAKLLWVVEKDLTAETSKSLFLFTYRIFLKDQLKRKHGDLS